MRTTEATVKEWPIPFIGAMVRAILYGRKTQTRRVINPVNATVDGGRWGKKMLASLDWSTAEASGARMRVYRPESESWHTVSPAYSVGDRLWGRETYISGYDVKDGYLDCYDEVGNLLPEKVWYAATDGMGFWLRDDGTETESIPWRSPVAMPRWASRITLEVAELRAQRVQEITEEDAIAEGVLTAPNTPEYQAAFDAAVSEGRKPPLGESPRERFARLWDSINAKRGYGWDTDPWVWAVTFRRVD